MASSTPLHPPATIEALRSSIVSDVTTATTMTTTTTKTDVQNQRNSSSSELTNITTTDISSHGEEEEEEEEGEQGSPSRRPGSESIRDSGYSPGFESMKKEGIIAPSDVIVSVPSPTGLERPLPTTTAVPVVMNGHADSQSEDDLSPPPLPSTLPPGEYGESDELSGDHHFSLPSPSTPPPPLPTSPMPDDDEGTLIHIAVMIILFCF